MDRREFLWLTGALSVGAWVGSSLWRSALAALPPCEPAQVGAGPYGPLLGPDANGILLPAGFQSRVIARSNQLVPGTAHTWHIFPDGGATFRAPQRGWIYVSNSEALGPVGVGALHFDRDGNVVDAYPILTGTILNCAGGPTPWRTWLSCEEHAGGHVWECDPSGAVQGVQRPALGTFQHEAVAAQGLRFVYLTEDRSDGCFYRFRPSRSRDLSAGLLEVAIVDPQGAVSWAEVPEPNSTNPATRHQVPESTPFAGGEGIVYFRHHVYFTTKGDNRVYDYDTRRERLSILYDANEDPLQQLTGVDNITATRGGDLLVAEDGGNMELVLISPDRIVSPLLQIVGQNGSEITGPAFDPRDGNRLYFSSQRGDGAGITYEVSGPFRRPGQTPRPTRCT